MRLKKNFFFCKKIKVQVEMRRENAKSLSEKDITINDGNNDKIELLGCHLGSQKCKKHLVLINKSYNNAGNYLLEKDYLNSISSLKSAYNVASELRDSTCSKCAALFRLTITNSLENINKELAVMTSGIFRKKRYQKSYIESCNALTEFKNRV